MKINTGRGYLPAFIRVLPFFNAACFIAR